MEGGGHMKLLLPWGWRLGWKICRSKGCALVFWITVTLAPVHLLARARVLVLQSVQYTLPPKRDTAKGCERYSWPRRISMTPVPSYSAE